MATITVEFEQAVQLVHEQATKENTGSGDPGGGVRLRAELAQLGKAASVQQLLGFIPTYLVHPKGPLGVSRSRLSRGRSSSCASFIAATSKAALPAWPAREPRGNGKTAFAAALHSTS